MLIGVSSRRLLDHSDVGEPSRRPQPPRRPPPPPPLPTKSRPSASASVPVIERKIDPESLDRQRLARVYPFLPDLVLMQLVDQATADTAAYQHKLFAWEQEHPYNPRLPEPMPPKGHDISHRLSHEQIAHLAIQSFGPHA